MKRAVLALFVACAPVPLGDGDRRVVAGDLVETVIAPTLDDVVAKAMAMRDAIHQFADPAKRDAAREAWRAARQPWKATEAFGFGPATDQRLSVAIDQVIDADKIDEELAATTPLTIAYVENLGANKKGFHAIEYLMFGHAESPRLLELLPLLADDLASNTQKLRDAWRTSYGDVLAKPGSANAAYPTIKEVIDTLVNESLFLVELVAKVRLGKPLGLEIGGTPQPELEESGPSDGSIDDMLATLEGVHDLYYGAIDGEGNGIGKLVHAQSPSTDLAVREAIDGARLAIAAIPRPFRTAIVDHRALVQEAYDRVIALKRLFGTEVIGVLGATLKFNDNDGD